MLSHPGAGKWRVRVKCVSVTTVSFSLISGQMDSAASLPKMVVVLPEANTLPSAKSQGLEGAPRTEVPVSPQVNTGLTGRRPVEQAGNQVLCLSQENSSHLPSAPLSPDSWGGWVSTHSLRTLLDTHVSTKHHKEGLGFV